MFRQKPIFISLALAGLIVATDTSALGLGRLNVSTALGQPFVAEIDLSIAPGDDFDSIRANIATPTVYRTANVEYQGVLQTMRVQTLRRANGQPFLRVTSNQAINDPYLDLLIEVNSNTGRLVREYVVLLDPAGAAQPQSVEATANPRVAVTAPVPAAPMPAPVTAAPPSVAPAAPRASAPAPAPRAAPAPTANASGGSYTVKGGDTLFSIATRNNPGVSVEQLMIAIQRANPNAFIGGNINRLRSGATLSLPSAGEAQAIAASEAQSEVRAQTASWRNYVGRVSDNVPTVSSETAQARASGRVSGAVTDSATSAPTSDRLKLSQGERTKAAATENKVATSKAIAEEKSKAAELAKTKENLEKALSLKSQSMADAQKKAQEAAKPPAPAPVAAAPAPAPVAPPAPAPAPAPAPVAPPVAVAAAPAPAPVAAPPAPAPAPAPSPALVVPPPVANPPPPPAPAPAAAPKPAVAATPVAAEPSFVDTLMENPIVPLGGLGVLLAGVGGLMWARKRKSSGAMSVDSKLSEPVVNTVNPDTVFGTSGLGVVKTNDAPIASQFSRSGMGTIDAGEVDPVAEAEVYIAYGREAQAEEILKEALARDPQRADVATKLAEMAATKGDSAGFDKWAADVAKMERGNEYADRLSELAAAHFPGHALASGASGAADKLSQAVTDAADSAKSSASSAMNYAGGAVAAGGAAVAASAFAVKDDLKDFFTDPTPTSPRTSTPAMTPPPAASKESLDFVLDGMTITAPSSVDKSADKTVPTVIPTIKPAADGKKKSLEDDLADLEASLKKATSSGQLPESSMDFTDFSTATPTNLGTVGPAMRPEMLDLSFDANRSGTMEPTPSILDGQWHDAATKLDLARAYEEMGDQEGAREILREVLHDGDESQKAEARALLAKLGG